MTYSNSPKGTVADYLSRIKRQGVAKPQNAPPSVTTPKTGQSFYVAPKKRPSFSSAPQFVRPSNEDFFDNRSIYSTISGALGLGGLGFLLGGPPGLVAGGIIGGTGGSFAPSAFDWLTGKDQPTSVLTKPNEYDVSSDRPYGLGKNRSFLYKGNNNLFGEEPEIKGWTEEPNAVSKYLLGSVRRPILEDKYRGYNPFLQLEEFATRNAWEEKQAAERSAYENPGFEAFNPARAISRFSKNYIGDTVAALETLPGRLGGTFTRSAKVSGGNPLKFLAATTFGQNENWSYDPTKGKGFLREIIETLSPTGQAVAQIVAGGVGALNLIKQPAMMEKALDYQLAGKVSDVDRHKIIVDYRKNGNWPDDIPQPNWYESLGPHWAYNINNAQEVYDTLPLITQLITQVATPNVAGQLTGKIPGLIKRAVSSADEFAALQKAGQISGKLISPKRGLGGILSQGFSPTFDVFEDYGQLTRARKMTKDTYRAAQVILEQSNYTPNNIYNKLHTELYLPQTPIRKMLNVAIKSGLEVLDLRRESKVRQMVKVVFPSLNEIINRFDGNNLGDLFFHMGNLGEATPLSNINDLNAQQKAAIDFFKENGMWSRPASNLEREVYGMLPNTMISPVSSVGGVTIRKIISTIKDNGDNKRFLGLLKAARAVPGATPEVRKVVQQAQSDLLIDLMKRGLSSLGDLDPDPYRERAWHKWQQWYASRFHFGPVIGVGNRNIVSEFFKMFVMDYRAMKQDLKYAETFGGATPEFIVRGIGTAENPASFEGPAFQGQITKSKNKVYNAVTQGGFAIMQAGEEAAGNRYYWATVQKFMNKWLPLGVLTDGADDIAQFVDQNGVRLISDEAIQAINSFARTVHNPADLLQFIKDIKSNRPRIEYNKELREYFEKASQDPNVDPDVIVTLRKLLNKYLDDGVSQEQISKNLQMHANNVANSNRIRERSYNEKISTSSNTFPKIVVTQQMLLVVDAKVAPASGTVAPTAVVTPLADVEFEELSKEIAALLTKANRTDFENKDLENLVARRNLLSETAVPQSKAAEAVVTKPVPEEPAGNAILLTDEDTNFWIIHNQPGTALYDQLILEYAEHGVSEEVLKTTAKAKIEAFQTGITVEIYLGEAYVRFCSERGLTTDSVQGQKLYDLWLTRNAERLGLKNRFFEGATYVSNNANFPEYVDLTQILFGRNQVPYEIKSGDDIILNRSISLAEFLSVYLKSYGLLPAPLLALGNDLTKVPREIFQGPEAKWSHSMSSAVDDFYQKATKLQTANRMSASKPNDPDVDFYQIGDDLINRILNDLSDATQDLLVKFDQSGDSVRALYPVPAIDPRVANLKTKQATQMGIDKLILEQSESTVKELGGRFYIANKSDLEQIQITSFATQKEAENAIVSLEKKIKGYNEYLPSSDVAAENINPYSKEAMEDAFNLTPEQSEAVDVLVKAMNLDESQIQVGKSGLAGQQALEQGKKASFELARDGKAIIRGLSSPDISSAIHEIAHVVRNQLININVPAEKRAGITDADISVIENWCKVQSGEWKASNDETFARGIERYFANGKAPTSQLQAVFEKLKKWFIGIYQTLKGSDIDVKISNNVRLVFDKLVTRSDFKPPPAAASISFDWGLFEENLYDNLDSFAPARHTGRRNYEMNDVASRFVEFAQKDTSGKSLPLLVSEFSKVDTANPSQIRKLKAAVKQVSEETDPLAPPPAAATDAVTDFMQGVAPAAQTVKGVASDLTLTTDREKIAALQVANDHLRDIQLDPNITSRQLPDMIKYTKNLIAFLENRIATNTPIKTGWWGGNKIAYTEQNAPENFLDFIFLEGHQSGKHGLQNTPESVTQKVEKDRSDWRKQQEFYKRLKDSKLTSPPAAAPAQAVVAAKGGIITDKSSVEDVIANLPNIPMFRGVRGENTEIPSGLQYFSSDEVFAKTYSDAGEAGEHRVTGLKNPLLVSDADWPNYSSNFTNPSEAIEKKLRANGYDGVVYPRKISEGKYLVIVLALDSENTTKSATLAAQAVKGVADAPEVLDANKIAAQTTNPPATQGTLFQTALPGLTPAQQQIAKHAQNEAYLREIIRLVNNTKFETVLNPGGAIGGKEAAQLDKYAKHILQRLTELRQVAMKVGTAHRDLLLFDYGMKFNFDRLIESVFSYPFWYLRHYGDYPRQLVSEPAYLAKMWQLSKIVERQNEDKELPNWMKQYVGFSVPNVFGLEDVFPDKTIYMPILSQIAPLNELLNGNFVNAEREKNVLGRVYNRLYGWGMGPHSLIPLAIGVINMAQGVLTSDEEAINQGAQYFDYLGSQTRLVPTITGYMEKKGAKLPISGGLSVDGIAMGLGAAGFLGAPEAKGFNYILKGLLGLGAVAQIYVTHALTKDGIKFVGTVYDQRRIANLLAQWAQEPGKIVNGITITPELLQDASIVAQNPGTLGRRPEYNDAYQVWSAAVVEARSRKLGPALLSYFGGPGFASRGPAEAKSELMYKRIQEIYDMEDDPKVSKEMYSEAWTNLSLEFPEMPIYGIFKRFGDDAFDTYAKIALGKAGLGTSRIAVFESVGLPYSLVSRFYEAKGISNAFSSTTEQMQFKEGIMRLNLLLKAPDMPTKLEWAAASRAYGKLMGELEIAYPGTTELQNSFFALEGEARDQFLLDHLDLKARRETEVAIMLNDPEYKAKLAPYYISISETESLVKLMYGQKDPQREAAYNILLENRQEWSNEKEKRFMADFDLFAYDRGYKEMQKNMGNLMGYLLEGVTLPLLPVIRVGGMENDYRIKMANNLASVSAKNMERAALNNAVMSGGLGSGGGVAGGGIAGMPGGNTPRDKGAQSSLLADWEENYSRTNVKSSGFIGEYADQFNYNLLQPLLKELGGNTQALVDAFDAPLMQGKWNYLSDTIPLDKALVDFVQLQGAENLRGALMLNASGGWGLENQTWTKVMGTVRSLSDAEVGRLMAQNPELRDLAQVRETLKGYGAPSLAALFDSIGAYVTVREDGSISVGAENVKKTKDKNTGSDDRFTIGDVSDYVSKYAKEYFGENIEELYDQYTMIAVVRGDKAAREFWIKNPQLSQYQDFSDQIYKRYRDAKKGQTNEKGGKGGKGGKKGDKTSGKTDFMDVLKTLKLIKEASGGGSRGNNKYFGVIQAMSKLISLQSQIGGSRRGGAGYGSQKQRDGTLYSNTIAVIMATNPNLANSFAELIQASPRRRAVILQSNPDLARYITQFSNQQLMEIEDSFQASFQMAAGNAPGMGGGLRVYQQRSGTTGL